MYKTKLSIICLFIINLSSCSLINQGINYGVINSKNVTTYSKFACDGYLKFSNMKRGDAEIALINVEKIIKTLNTIDHITDINVTQIINRNIPIQSQLLIQFADNITTKYLNNIKNKKTISFNKKIKVYKAIFSGVRYSLIDYINLFREKDIVV